MMRLVQPKSNLSNWLNLALIAEPGDSLEMTLSGQPQNPSP